MWQNKLNLRIENTFIIENMLSSFGYTVEVKDYNNLKTESIVNKNNNIINQNQEKYERIAQDISEHYVQLKKTK